MAATSDAPPRMDRWPFGVKLMLALYAAFLMVGLSLGIHGHQTSLGHGRAMILSFALVGDPHPVGDRRDPRDLDRASLQTNVVDAARDWFPSVDSIGRHNLCTCPRVKRCLDCGCTRDDLGALDGPSREA
jgi:hypothetical protein